MVDIVNKNPVHLWVRIELFLFALFVRYFFTPPSSPLFFLFPFFVCARAAVESVSRNLSRLEVALCRRRYFEQFFAHSLVVAISNRFLPKLQRLFYFLQWLVFFSIFYLVCLAESFSLIAFLLFSMFIHFFLSFFRRGGCMLPVFKEENRSQMCHGNCDCWSRRRGLVNSGPISQVISLQCAILFVNNRIMK